MDDGGIGCGGLIALVLLAALALWLGPDWSDTESTAVASLDCPAAAACESMRVR